MKEISKKEVFLDCLRRYRLPAVLYLAITVTQFVVFGLYNSRTEACVYAAVLAAALLLASFGFTFFRQMHRAEQRAKLAAGLPFFPAALPASESKNEADYRRMLEALSAQVRQMNAALESQRQETLDYCTVWVHQIKTPIAVMRLRLQEEDSEEHRALETELFRIEQYVEMMLQYIRMESDTNDLVIARYALDDLLREAFRKFAPQFVYKKLKLEYETVDLQIVTDKKWFLCILDQLLSNAIKYTPAGGTVRVYLPEERQLCVEDNGVGIAAEDLPRIFEKGFTGHNGRLGQNSSGLGLFLCKRAAELLSLRLSVISAPGEGSAFYVDLGNPAGRPE